MSIHFVIAPDSFKESLSAQHVCDAVERGIGRAIADAIVTKIPMADGGEGTVDAMLAALDGEKVLCTVQGPLQHQTVQTYFALIENGQTAVIEMAKASGMELLPVAQRNPALTSTFGTGQMIQQALDLGVSKIIIGLGGSATNDAGVGMAQALGVQFFDQHDQPVHGCGGHLNLIHSMDLTQLDPRLQQTEVLIASDVNNPLYGPNGAAAIYAPQKGADAVMVQQLDYNLEYFADLIKTQTGKDVAQCTGAGAAGGLGYGLMVFADAQFKSGAQLLMELTGLEQKIQAADYVITGEGRMDAQTEMGKTPWAVAQLAKRYGKPVIAFTGVTGQGVEQLLGKGFEQIIAITPPSVDLETAYRQAATFLEDAAYEWASLLEA